MDLKRLLFLFFWLNFLNAHAVASKDSLGILRLRGSKFIVYKVEKGDNIYSLTKRFNISGDDISHANGDTLKELHDNVLILIPTIRNNRNYCIKKHIVKSGESFYSIAKDYNCTIEELKSWNHINPKKLKKNDTIYIHYPCSSQQEEKENQVPKKTNKTADSKKENGEVKKENENSGKDNNETHRDDNETPKDYNISKKDRNDHNSGKDSVEMPDENVEETGVGSWFDNPSLNGRKNIALHKDAPIGTIIKLVNVMNGKSVHVKVVGRLPEKAEAMDQIILITKYTANILNIKDKNFRVKLYYRKHNSSN